MRNVTPSSTPSAHATAALIGDTWLTAITRPSAVVSRSCAELRRRAVTATQALTAGRREVGIGEPRRTALRADLRERQAVPLAVVELQQPVVGLDRAAGDGRDRGRGLPRPPQRARDDARRPARPHSAPRRVRPARGPRSDSSRSARPCSRPSRLCAVCPCRTKSITSLAPPRSRGARSARTRAGARDRRDRIASTPTTRPRGRGPLRSARRATAASSAICGMVVPETGHQKTSLCNHAPPSTRLVNQPIARLNARRRRSRRPRPAVSAIVSVSTTTADSSVCAYASSRNGASSASGSNAPNAIRRKSRPGLWNTFQTPKIEPNASQSTVSPSTVRRIPRRRAPGSRARRPRCSPRAGRAAGRRRRIRRATRAPRRAAASC